MQCTIAILLYSSVALLHTFCSVYNLCIRKLESKHTHGLSQKGISYLLVEQLQRWYYRDSLLWLQVTRSENDIQKNCSSGTFQPRRSSSGTKVQEGGSSWSKCPLVPDNDFYSQSVVPLQLICTTVLWIITSLSMLLSHLSTSLSLPMKRWKNAI